MIVFDLDDTLFPEQQYVRSGFAAVGRFVASQLDLMGFGEAALALFEQGRRGDIFDRAFEQLAGRPARPEEVQAMVRVYREHQPCIQLYPDALRTLDELTAAPGVVLAIITDGPLVAQQRKVAALGLEQRFAYIHYSDAYGRERWKPHPFPFQATERQLGAAGADCVYIGDNPHKDVLTPRSLGWSVIHLRRTGGIHTAAIELPSDVPVIEELSSHAIHSFRQ